MITILGVMQKLLESTEFSIILTVLDLNIYITKKRNLMLQNNREIREGTAASIFRMRSPRWTGLKPHDISLLIS